MALASEWLLVRVPSNSGPAFSPQSRLELRTALSSLRQLLPLVKYLQLLDERQAAVFGRQVVDGGVHLGLLPDVHQALLQHQPLRRRASLRRVVFIRQRCVLQHRPRLLRVGAVRARTVRGLRAGGGRRPGRRRPDRR